jgi:hypothetical protein
VQTLRALRTKDDGALAALVAQPGVQAALDGGLPGGREAEVCAIARRAAAIARQLASHQQQRMRTLGGGGGGDGRRGAAVLGGELHPLLLALLQQAQDDLLPDEAPPPVLPNEPSTITITSTSTSTSTSTGTSTGTSTTPLAAPTAAPAVVQHGADDQWKSCSELPSSSATAAPAAAQAVVQPTASISRHALRRVAATQLPGAAASKARPAQQREPQLVRPPWQVADILWQVSTTPHATQMHVPHASVDRLRGPHRPRGPKGARQMQYRCVETQAWPNGLPAAWLTTPPRTGPSKSASAPSFRLLPSVSGSVGRL